MVDISVLLELILEGRDVRFIRTHQTGGKNLFILGTEKMFKSYEGRQVVGQGVSECYLSSAETNHQVGDEGVLCFSRAVAHHHTPAVLLGQLTPEGTAGVEGLSHGCTYTVHNMYTHTHADIHSRLDGLGNRSNLVDF